MAVYKCGGCIIAWSEPIFGNEFKTYLITYALKAEAFARVLNYSCTVHSLELCRAFGKYFQTTSEEAHMLQCQYVISAN